jgi:integrase
LPLPPLEPRALTAGQVRSLKDILDRLERFHQQRAAPAASETEAHRRGRSLRDRAIIYLLLSTGLRREELLRLDLDQLAPDTPDALWAARKAKVNGVRGKGRTHRHVYVFADARTALADYLERERPRDAGPARPRSSCPPPRLAPAARTGACPRSINTICEQIGRWHDADHPNPTVTCPRCARTTCATASLVAGLSGSSRHKWCHAARWCRASMSIMK